MIFCVLLLVCRRSNHSNIMALCNKGASNHFSFITEGSKSEKNTGTNTKHCCHSLVNGYLVRGMGRGNWFILFESMIINHRHHNLEVGLSITRWQEGCFSSSDKGGSSISPSALSTISISNWYQYQYRHQLSAQFPLSHKTKNWSPGSLLVVPPLAPPLCINIGVILLRCVFYSLGRIEVGYLSGFQSAT